MLEVCGDLSGTSAPPLALPPRGFREARDIRWARPTTNPHHHTHGRGRESSSPPSGAQLAGLRYEAKIKDLLVREFGLSFLGGPWWEFYDGVRRRYCQPDGTVIRGDRVTIFEIKLRWCPEAWWQLTRLYLPVALSLYPKARFALCAVVRSFDPAVPTPSPVRLIREIGEVESSSDLVVLPWKV